MIIPEKFGQNSGSGFKEEDILIQLLTDDERLVKGQSKYLPMNTFDRF